METVEIKEKVYFEEYKDLVKLCLKEGEILPSLLERIEVPPKYDFTDKELNNLKISEDSSSKRQQKIMEQEAKIGEITFDGDITKFADEIKMYYNEELMNFVAKYPVYQKLLK